MKWICVGLFAYFTFSHMQVPAVQMFFVYGLVHNVSDILYAKVELRSRGYPKSKCMPIGKYHVLFGSRRRKDELMPIDLIKLVKFWYVLVIIMSVIDWTIGIAFPWTLKYIFYIELLVFVAADVYWGLKPYNYVFYKKYKRFTWRNWKYYDWSSLNHPDPEARLLESCIVTEIKRKRKRIYVTVRGEESKKMIDKVLFCGKGECHMGETYALYQICDVKYIES